MIRPPSAVKALCGRLGISPDQLASRIVINQHPVNRRTLYKWESRGADFTDEAALRRWCANQGMRIETLTDPRHAMTPASEPDPGQSSQLAQIAPFLPAGQEANANAGTGAAGTGSKAEPSHGSATARVDHHADGTRYSPNQLAAARTAELRDEQILAARDERLQRTRKLLTSEQVIKIVIDGLALHVLTGLTDLPGKFLRTLTTLETGANVTIHAEARPLLRQALDRELIALRVSITADTRERLARLFDPTTEIPT